MIEIRRVVLKVDKPCGIKDKGRKYNARLLKHMTTQDWQKLLIKLSGLLRKKH
jgi:hypothetical protein